MNCGDIMAELDISISIEEQIDSIESIDEARNFLDEYHGLHESGGEELTDLLFALAREGIGNEYLRFVFEAHLLGCEDCLHTLSRYQLIFKTVDECGAEPIKAIWAGKLLDEAEAHQEQGSFEGAKKCLKKALELRPWDEEIQGKLLDLSGGEPGSTEIPEDLGPIVALLSSVKAMNTFSGSMTLFQDPLLRAGMFDAEKGIEEDIYLLGEGISIDLKPPRDGYLTILLYNDKNNLKLLFPERTTDDTFIKGGEKKQFEIVAAEPLGQQYLKAFLTTDQLMVPDQIDFGDESSFFSAIRAFLNSISDLGDDEWMVFEHEFEVVAE